jgi:hypothetical protein
MPSTQEGQGVFLKSIDKPTYFPKRMRLWIDGIDKLPRSRMSDAMGVGNNPDALTLVGRSKI